MEGGVGLIGLFKSVVLGDVDKEDEEDVDDEDEDDDGELKVDGTDGGTMFLSLEIIFLLLLQFPFSFATFVNSSLVLILSRTGILMSFEVDDKISMRASTLNEFSLLSMINLLSSNFLSLISAFGKFASNALSPQSLIEISELVFNNNALAVDVVEEDVDDVSCFNRALANAFISTSIFCSIFSNEDSRGFKLSKLTSILNALSQFSCEFARKINSFECPFNNFPYYDYFFKSVSNYS
jgi:hypothetical protein